jgi:CRISPR-associated protein (TIGR03984 family)
VTDPRTPPTPLLTARAPETATATAAEALAWCWPAPGQDVIGFGYAVDRAVWFRLHADGPHGPDGRTLPLDGLYEIVAFDADKELRWLLDTDGATTHAVVLAEDRALLPDGADATGGPALHRFTPHDGSPPAHLLAEHVARPGAAPACDDWARLHSHRYAEAFVPYRWPSSTPAADDPALRLALEYVEYVSEDDHGNLTVAETRLTGIRPYHPVTTQEG